MKAIRLDLAVSCAGEPTKGHNRWHPAIPPALRVEPGESFELDTRDALDGQIGPGSSADDIPGLRRTRSHALTGPVHVAGAEPGDVLEIEVEDVRPAAFGYTYFRPGGGFLPLELSAPALARWQLAGGFATSADIPGVRIPAAPFLGVMGVAPSAELLEEVVARESRAGASIAPPPDPMDAVPAAEPVASRGLRTTPPREFGGNMDVRQLVAGARLLLPVFVPGGLLSVGDAHFAQGDGEVCGTAIEMCAMSRLRVAIHKGAARERGISQPQISGSVVIRPPGRFYATTGSSLAGPDRPAATDLGAAARSALRAMLDHLCRTYGYERWQALLLASVVVELRISQVVNGPAHTVTAFLPTDIFVSGTEHEEPRPQ